ncbi:hypothetical protein JOB18_027424 [Solea senegalensis]|uniref:ZP domain-containing protein n=1 Tax=Solea senegalensis TaxID=28829 RepID=A0AAV6PY41_SOLSE|nr:zona pellucida sperm-binding protein 3-like [Solea senegalensis]KAG7479528.1 hypothetical protein JOB18_027424 [Solea senegalensis]
MLGSSVIIVFLLACVSFSDAFSLSRRVPTYWRAEAQRHATAPPERKPSRSSAQQYNGLQVEQSHVTDGALAWRFPEAPVDPVTRPPVEFEVRRPVTPDRIAVRCGESRIQVELYQDLLGLNKLIQPEEINLGGCPPTEIDDLSHVLVFESELHGCGSTLMMTEDNFIYTFTLVYNPKVLDKSGITRRQSAVIGVECHYPRRI